MGKKNKMVIEDPILKRNFKYQKRKKEKQMEKQKIKQQQEEEEKRMKQLRQIEMKIQQDIEKHFQNEKNQLLRQSNKKKHIAKLNPLLNAFKTKQSSTLSNLQTVESTKTYEEQFTKNLSSCSVRVQQNPYTRHFHSNLPKSLSELLTKQKKLTQAMKMEEQIKSQIKSMFSVKKVGEQQQNDFSKTLKTKVEEGIFGGSQGKKLEEALEEEQKQQEPYIIDKKGKTQTQGLIDGKIVSLSKLASQSLVQSTQNKIQKETEQTINPLQKQYQVAESLITNYGDYIHVQNNEEKTIEQFRKLVIRHMYQHQLSCLKALKQNKKSKGFTNSKFLIITPYVGDAKSIFDIIEEEFMKDIQQQIPEQIVEELKNPKKKKRTLEWVIQNKEKIQQNEDDEDDFFRVGIKILPRKKKIVYFSNFDASDIIVASPIGLKSIINGQSGKKQISFLSSVEVLYVDRASVISMQNWDHLLDIYHNLNYMPKYASLKNSINDIRQEFLELKGRIYRQNIVFTQFGFPELNSLKINHFHNWQGCVTSRPIFRPVVLQENSNIEKNFYKIELKQPKDDLQARFEYFKRKFWDKLHNNDNMKKIILFVNSYFQFVKLKGFLEKVNASFEAISEHTKKQKIQSRVSLFNNNSYRILLLTERAYYFGLCQIKKHRHIYFYSLPKNSFIYKDLIENIQQDADEGSKIVSIYSKYDKFIVERLVGSAKAVQMVKEYCTNVSFIV